MPPAIFDPHVCEPPSTADLIGREMDFEVSLRPALAAGALLREGRLALGALVDTSLTHKHSLHSRACHGNRSPSSRVS
jgi:hypothetical protein